MASFGSFETEREVYSDPIYTVYTARKSGDPTSEYAVKVFSIQRVGFDPDTATDLAPLLVDIESSRMQCIDFQAKGAAGSRFIAPVLERGQDERGVWYATRFYHHSVNRIIIGKVALPREALQHIIRSIAQGALDLKRACGRSHGDIRPSNIQISKSQKLSEAEVVLSDPMPGGEEETVMFEINDLRSIGRILLQLVQQRAIGNEEDFLILPILSSAEWTRLFGKDEPAWLSLCNRLLDPNLSLEQLTLERLMAELVELEPKAKVSAKLLIAVAAAVLGVGVVTFLLLRPRGQSVEVTSDPSGATILVDKKEQKGKTPLKLKLEKGSYLIEARYEGLGSLSNNLVVPGASPSLTFPFVYGRVALSSDPGRAIVVLDGKEVGQTPYRSDPLAPGQRTYVLSLPDYQPFQVQVLVPSDRTVASAPEVKLARVKLGEFSVDISSEPDGAIIYEGTNKLGAASLTKYFPSGKYQLSARFPDWPDASGSTQIVVVAAAKTNFNFRLPYGRVRFDVTPSEAEILLNNKLLGIGQDMPPKILPPGEYSWLVRKAGYHSFETKMTLKDGLRETLTANLEPMLGRVEFTSDPRGATIFDAKDLVNGLGQTPTNLSFRPGPYSFVARYPDLDEIRTPTMTVSLGSTIRTNLQFNYGAVEFGSIPQPADLTIGGTIRKQTPYKYFQKPGTVLYRMEATDYYREEGVTNVIAGKSVPVSFRLRPKQVTVVLRSDPPGAKFDLGGVPAQGTNDLYSLPWGTYNITARYAMAGLPELDAVTKLVEVDKGGKTEVPFQFQYGTLEVTNVESEARLSYKGQLVSSHLPATLLLKPELPDDILLEYGADFKTNIPARVAAGKSRRVGFPLPELRSIYTNKFEMILVRVSPNLYAGQFEVTEGQYRGVRNEPLQVKKLQPVVLVGLADAQSFCETLTAADKDSLDRQKLSGWRYGLPTEAEWKIYADTNPDVLAGSLFSQNGLTEPAEIDPNRKSKSQQGLYDVFGNAAEWCLDAAGKPIMMGGSVNKPRPKPDRALSLREEPTETVMKEGSRSTGFRCVLRKGPSP